MSGLRNIARSAFAASFVAVSSPAFAQTGYLGLAPSPDAGETMDRYGGGPGTSPSPTAPSRQSPPTRFLDWSGKTPTPALGASSSPSPQADRSAPPTSSWLGSSRPTAAAIATRSPQPSYNPSAAQQTPTLPAAPKPASMAAQKAPGGPRFYSMHRDYGLQPDAIPLPPQFFGPTADLSVPATDPAVRRVLGADGQMHMVQSPPDTQGSQ